MAGIRADKDRDATDGYDGGWVAPRPGGNRTRSIRCRMGDRPNQIDKQRDDVNVVGSDLLNFQPENPITEAGLRMNINVGVQYLGAWISATAAYRSTT